MTSTCSARDCAKFAKEKSERAFGSYHEKADMTYRMRMTQSLANIHPTAGTLLAPSSFLRVISIVCTFD